jgi:hypothetical protein
MTMVEYSAFILAPSWQRPGVDRCPEQERWEAALPSLAACLTEAGYPAESRPGPPPRLRCPDVAPPYEVMLTAAALCGVVDLVLQIPRWQPSFPPDPDDFR